MSIPPRPPHHHPADEPEEHEPGALPVEPDLGPAPPTVPDAAEHDGTPEADR